MERELTQFSSEPSIPSEIPSISGIAAVATSDILMPAPSSPMSRGPTYPKSMTSGVPSFEVPLIVDNLLVPLIGGISIAMPTVLSVTMAIGSHRLSQQGAIAKRMTAIEEMAGMDVLCSDKT